MAVKAEKWNDIGLLILRIGLGLVLLYYGSQKVLGVFGGSGFQAQLSKWEIERGIPTWLGILAITSEFAGSIAVMLGLLTRVAAFGMLCTMLTAAWFNLNRPGMAQDLLSGGSDANRFGFPFALACMAASLMLTGAGAYSIDRKLFKKGR